MKTRHLVTLAAALTLPQMSFAEGNQHEIQFGIADIRDQDDDFGLSQ